jgi:hypothetical protein
VQDKPYLRYWLAYRRAQYWPRAMHLCFPPIVADVQATVARGDAAAGEAGTAPISANATIPASTRVRNTWLPFRSDSSGRGRAYLCGSVTARFDLDAQSRVR